MEWIYLAQDLVNTAISLRFQQKAVKSLTIRVTVRFFWRSNLLTEVAYGRELRWWRTCSNFKI